MGNPAPGMRLRRIIDRRARSDRFRDDRIDIIDNEVEMHGRPVPRVAPRLAGRGAGDRPRFLHQQVERRRAADQLDAAIAEPPPDLQIEQRRVERSRTREIVDVDVDENAWSAHGLM